jgi:uncharacterized protein (DUF302 family)
MSSTTRIPVEHVVVASNQPYQQVINALEARLGTPINWETVDQQSANPNASWEQFTQTIEAHVGTSGLTFFYKVGHSQYLLLLGKNSRAIQYTIGNALLAAQMTKYTPEAALYAPLKIVVYQDEEGRTFVAYDNFASLLAQYKNEEIDRAAQQVEQKLKALVADVTGPRQT